MYKQFKFFPVEGEEEKNSKTNGEGKEGQEERKNSFGTST